MKLKYTGQFEVSLEFTPENVQWLINKIESYKKDNNEEMLSKVYNCLKDGVEYASMEHIKECLRCAINECFIENIAEFSGDLVDGFEGAGSPYLKDFRSELKEDEDKQLCLNI